MQGRVLLAVLLLGAGRAQAAAPGDVAAAEALFAQGKELMASSDFEHACPKLEESYRLDPATGALYAVALCHEGQGKLASAWGEFMDVAARASQERNAERERAARRRAQMLEPRLPFITVTLDAKLVDLPGLVVLRDGAPLRRAAWGAAIPVDSGPHVVRVEAAGYESWTKTVTIDTEGQRAVVEVNALVKLQPAKTGDEQPQSRHAPPPATPPPRSDRPLRTTAIALGAAGVSGMVVAGVATWRALANKSAAEGECPRETGCSSEGVRRRAAALEVANMATGAAIVGGALLAAGATLFIYDRVESNRAARNPSLAISVGPGGLQVTRSF